MALPPLPSEEKLTYIKLLAEVLLLGLLVPLFFWAVARNPSNARDRALGRVPL